MYRGSSRNDICRIADLRPRSYGNTLLVRVLEVSVLAESLCRVAVTSSHSNVLSGQVFQVAEVLVADESGSVCVVAVGKEVVSMIPGHCLYISNAHGLFLINMPKMNNMHFIVYFYRNDLLFIC